MLGVAMLVRPTKAGTNFRVANAANSVPTVD